MPRFALHFENATRIRSEALSDLKINSKILTRFPPANPTFQERFANKRFSSSGNVVHQWATFRVLTLGTTLTHMVCPGGIFSRGGHQHVLPMGRAFLEPQMVRTQPSERGWSPILEPGNRPLPILMGSTAFLPPGIGTTLCVEYSRISF